MGYAGTPRPFACASREADNVSVVPTAPHGKAVQVGEVQAVLDEVRNKLQAAQASRRSADASSRSRDSSRRSRDRRNRCRRTSRSAGCQGEEPQPLKRFFSRQLKEERGAQFGHFRSAEDNGAASLLIIEVMTCEFVGRVGAFKFSWRKLVTPPVETARVFFVCVCSVVE